MRLVAVAILCECVCELQAFWQSVPKCNTCRDTFLDLVLCANICCCLVACLPFSPVLNILNYRQTVFRVVSETKVTPTAGSSTQGGTCWILIISSARVHQVSDFRILTCFAFLAAVHGRPPAYSIYPPEIRVSGISVPPIAFTSPWLRHHT